MNTVSQNKNFSIKSFISDTTRDIRFWILIFSLIRLIGITNPPLETGHNWRQSLTNMVARNFYESGPDLFHPTIDMDGNKSGVIGSEFPFFNLLIYLFDLIFGYSHWYGRLINLVISGFGIYFFHELIRKYFKNEVAFYASLVLLVSIWFSYSRKIMPDTFSVSLMMAGLYYAAVFIEKKLSVHLVLFILLSSLGILCKIPSAYFLALYLIPVLHPKVEVRIKIALGFACLMITFIFSLWYFVWVPHLISVYGYRLYFPKDLVTGIREIASLWPQALEKFYFSALNSYMAFIMVLSGIFFLIREWHKYLILALLAMSAVFFFFMVRTGSVFPLHNYYIIPFVPVMALLAGLGIAKINFRFRWILLLVIGVEGIANQQHDFFIKESEKYKLQLESVLNQFGNKNDLIIINGNGSPQQMYFAHRKGWNVTDAEIVNDSLLVKLSGEGATLVVINRHSTEVTPSIGHRVYKDENYLILRLQQP